MSSLLARGERDGVIGQRADRHVFDHLFESGAAGGLLHVARLGVAGKSVGEPPVVTRCRTDRDSPPLVGDGVGQQPVIDLGGNPAAGDGSNLRRPRRGNGVIRQLDDPQCGVGSGA